MTRAQAAARELICRFGEHEPERLAELLDILVLTCDLPETVEGFYQLYDDQAILYLNERLPSRRRRVVCGHELGHAMLHGASNTLLLGTQETRIEREADLFCAELLLADWTPEQTDIASIVRETALPEWVVRYQFQQL